MQFAQGPTLQHRKPWLEVDVQDTKSTAASRAFLLAAVVLGVLATILAFAFISNSGAGSHGPPNYIVIASHDLSPNAALDPDRDLRQLPIPPDAAFQPLVNMSLNWDSRALYKGQRVNRDIKAGQPVLLADLAAVGQLVLEKPYYALSIPAEPGMIIPGDYVKIIVTRPTILGPPPGSPAAPPAIASQPFEAQIIGKDDGYKVLAVGGYLYKTRAQATLADQYSQGGSNLQSVTLQVTDAQAREIMSALGNLTSSSQKAVLLLCPGPNTAAPATEPSAARP